MIEPRGIAVARRRTDGHAAVSAGDGEGGQGRKSPSRPPSVLPWAKRSGTVPERVSRDVGPASRSPRTLNRR